MRLGLATSGVTYHPTLGQANYSAIPLSPYPDQQVAQTIGVMRKRVNEDAASPEFQQWAASICGNPADSESDVVQRAFQHVRNAIQFTRDEAIGANVGGYPADDVVEVIIRPIDMARYVSQGIAMGDCDDFSQYVACLLTCYGIPCEFVTVAADGRAPMNFSHVYVAAYPINEETGERERIALDTSHGQYPGWEVPNQYGKFQQWPLSGGLDFITVALAAAAGIFAINWISKDKIFA